MNGSRFHVKIGVRSFHLSDQLVRRTRMNTTRVYTAYRAGIKANPTRSFHVARTSRPAILTVEPLSASVESR